MQLCLRNRRPGGFSRFYSTPKATTHQLRESFLSYFESQGHLKMPSSNLVPDNDPSLLFTSAGMVQFKDYFLDRKTPPFSRLTSAQKCLRAGGKHNDLDMVGRTSRHQTFFEMLGNFSFGDYKKEDAIHYALEYLTKVVQLPKDRLAVSVLKGDDESADLWRKEGFSDDKIFRLGVEDNFWMMSDTSGPCGPCTEIFWDQLEEVDGDRYLEIWNLVFMQSEQSLGSDGNVNRTPLPRLCIDTGMGLERLASVVQGKPTNFDIDCMKPIQESILDIMAYSELDPEVLQLSLRVISDHLRAAAMLLAEGVIPECKSRGHVLRRLIRRACLAGRRIGINDPFLFKMFDTIQITMGGDSWHPQLREREAFIKDVLHQEELAFRQIFNIMNKKLSRHIKFGLKKLEPILALELVRSNGVPVEVLEEYLKANEIQLDQDQFDFLRKRELELSKGTWKGSGDKDMGDFFLWEKENIFPKFTGYESTTGDTTILAGTMSPTKEAHLFVAWVAPHQSPFYGESGGQVGDTGCLIEVATGKNFPVTDTIVPYPNGIALKVVSDDYEELENFIKVGNPITCLVDLAKRRGLCHAHTGTHLLHSALRELVSRNIFQAGSKVECDSIRFDYAWNEPLGTDKIFEIEDWVNRAISADHPVISDEMNYEDAVGKGALALFSEKYPPSVRVVAIPGVSTEICCGTHVSNTGSIASFKIISDSAIGTGRRRLYAIVGNTASEWLRNEARRLSAVATLIKASTTQSVERVGKLLQEKEALKGTITTLKQTILGLELKASQINSLIGSFDGIPVKVQRPSSSAVGLQEKDISTMISKISDQQPDFVHLMIKDNMIFCASRLQSVDCGKTLSAILKDMQGKGGGSKWFASGSLSTSKTTAEFQRLCLLLRIEIDVPNTQTK